MESLTLKKTSRRQDPNVEDMLTPASQNSRNYGPSLIQELGTSDLQTRGKPTSPEDALEVLRHDPEYQSLVSTLRYLAKDHADGPAGFNIRRPTPLSAQLIQVLVTEIAPNYWTLLKEDANEEKTAGLGLLLSCLRSAGGINAILTRLRAHTQDVKSQGSRRGERRDLSMDIGILLDLICHVLEGDARILDIWKVTTGVVDNPGKGRPLVQELLSIFGSGKTISLAAEAEGLLDSSSKKSIGSLWVSDSVKYTTWLSDNIMKAQSAAHIPEQSKFFPSLFGKALHLGHPEIPIRKMLSALILVKDTDPQHIASLLDNLPQTEQRKVLFSALKILSADYLNRLGNCESAESQAVISAVAGAIKACVGVSEIRRGHLTEWLTGSSAAGLGEGIGIRRAALAVVSQEKDSAVAVLEKSINQFGDQLYIKHSPMLQQEAHAQVLILAAGYLHKKSPLKLSMLLKSSAWMNAISNRLAAPHLRARFLGMVVGEALSGLVDKDDKKLNFKMEETERGEGKWYKDLVRVLDQVGTVDSLLKPQTEAPIPKKIRQAAPIKPSSQPRQQGFIIEELSDDELSDDDVVAYGKPDSDEEDSDEDATLVRRDKPKAPVYIRDLIRYLRDTENYDHQKLALMTAPTLIRRKANYGKEVSEHAEELAGLLVGLQDKYEIENFDDLKLQGMIALVVAQPQAMGAWFSKTFFDGDYSVSQRASVLVVLGLSARELAGFETSEYAAAASFPSKTLPERVEKLFIGEQSSTERLPSSSLKALPPNALDTMARSITSDFLAPLAATAADAATGPDVLKLSTFNSRLQNDQEGSSNPKVKIKSRTKPQIRTIKNTTAQLLSTSFFSPLTARFQAAIHSSASRTRGIIFQPHLLALYIKTLALLLHAAGPTTLALPQMTAELWGLLLNTGVRVQAVGDLSVTQALLFALLALLDVNEDRMRDVCRDLGREVVETQEWVGSVFGGLRGGDGGEEEQVKMMAAGVLVRLNEGIEKYRLLMVGDLIGYG
ncbi:telomere length regulation protein-domain-containing protein [Cercophora newfieldiana]|uniref:Telomere length regulation protein-domain-containing protein n=1 Tax=Cercophora newfieldiana TaxID=92897 RepID=A0AA40CZ23_9PEZI|nr:telomere length regulation protein-domain-containing protein [Cercophora newfieldiana]